MCYKSIKIDLITRYCKKIKYKKIVASFSPMGFFLIFVVLSHFTKKIKIDYKILIVKSYLKILKVNIYFCIVFKKV